VEVEVDEKEEKRQQKNRYTMWVGVYVYTIDISFSCSNRFHVECMSCSTVGPTLVPPFCLVIRYDVII
jgi:hypothetical protein